MRIRIIASFLLLAVFAMNFEFVRNTPKALANFSPGLFQPWESNIDDVLTPKALAS
ncbi:MAG TPA: hypothetical protein VJS13_15835 [Pyrinomonadaceae bacterium]|nr:hypothetical protein [Pyrinomonadaceae bacterium]